MPNPAYPFQPFIEVNITDVKEVFYDRIFVPDDVIKNGLIPTEFFLYNLQQLTARLGYPFRLSDLENEFGFNTNIDNQLTLTIPTKTELLGLVTIDYQVIGLDNFYPETVDDGDESKIAGISVISHILEIARYNNYRYERQFLMSKIAVMVLPLDERTKGNKNEWLFYHINNFMNRGYKIIIEDESVAGATLKQYIIDTSYTNCVLVTEGNDYVCEKPLIHQPIEACSWNYEDTPTIELGMRRFATHLIDPSSDLIKQTTALIALYT